MKIQAWVFKWTFLPVKLCRKGIDQNFDCGCILKKGYANLHLLANPKKKLQYRELLA